MHSKKGLIILTVVLIMTMLVSGCQGSSTANNEVVAKVDDQEITRNEYDKHLALIKNDYEGMYGENIWSLDYDGKTFLQAVQEQVLDKIINDVAIKNYLESNNVTLDEQVIEERYTKSMEAIEKQTDVKDLFKENNIDEAFIKNQIKTELYMEKFYNMAVEEVDLTDENLKKYYEEHSEEYMSNLAKASHILVESEEEAKNILEKINSGEDFAKLATEFSKDPGSAQQGGQLGVFSKGMMVPEFEEVAFSLKPGEISEPVKSQYGYHIIKAFEVTFEDVKEDTKNLLINEKYMRKLEDVKADMKIEKFEEKIK